VSKVLETPCADCGMGNRHQQSMYSICKCTYMEESCRGSECACKEGEVSKVLES
jgi:hypothetical protein